MEGHCSTGRSQQWAVVPMEEEEEEKEGGGGGGEEEEDDDEEEEGYVEHMGDRRSAHRILVGRRDGKRQLGRNRLR